MSRERHARELRVEVGSELGPVRLEFGRLAACFLSLQPVGDPGFLGVDIGAGAGLLGCGSGGEGGGGGGDAGFGFELGGVLAVGWGGGGVGCGWGWTGCVMGVAGWEALG